MENLLDKESVQKVIKVLRDFDPNLKVEAYDPGIFASPLRSQTFPGENKNKIMTANKAAKIFIKNYKNNY